MDIFSAVTNQPRIRTKTTCVMPLSQVSEGHCPSKIQRKKTLVALNGACLWLNSSHLFSRNLSACASRESRWHSYGLHAHLGSRVSHRWNLYASGIDLGAPLMHPTRLYWSAVFLAMTATSPEIRYL